MRNVGDEVVLGLSSVSAAGTNIYSYAFKFWDGSSTASESSFVTKRINIGGNPNDNRLLNYTCNPVALDGQTVEISGSLQANNPPYIVPSPTISANDTYFPYQTELKITTYDYENDEIRFAWFQGDTYLGPGSTTFAGTYEGTWQGNGTTLLLPVLAYENGTTISIASQRLITCYVTDVQNGTTEVDFALRGFLRPPPSTGIQAEVSSLTTDSSSLPTARIGPDQTVYFEVYAKDVTGAALAFTWVFSLDYNWTVVETVAGTTVAMPDGGFRNHYVKDISGEVISSGTQKVVTGLCQIVGPSGSTQTQFDVTLYKNNPPTGVTITTKVGGNVVDPTVAQPAGTMLEFEAVPTDPDLDVCQLQWTFSQSVYPSVLVLYGPKIYVDTTGYTTNISGQVVCTDEAGASVSVAVPSVPITP